MSLLARMSLIYILYVPRRGIKTGANAAELKQLAEAAARLKATAVFSPLNYDVLDDAIERMYTVEEVFSHIHKRSFRSLDRIWVAGRGSSLYAREVIRTAHLRGYGIPVSNYTPETSCLGPYIRMFRHFEARQAYIKGESRGLMLPG